MALIVLCGHPSSGKSKFAADLACALKQQDQEVVIVDEQSLNLKRNASYKDVPSEKNTRSLLKSTTDRHLTRSRIIIFDSLNFIKGYRYELWCIARSVGTRYCMVHIDTLIETCKQWNEQREGDRYSAAIFEDLAGRFERPDARNRWDAPLFTVKPILGDVHVQEQVQAVSVAATQGVTVATAAAVAVGASTAAPVGKVLEPTFATKGKSLSTTNLLHDMDKAAQDVVDRITQASADAAGGPPGTIKFEDDLPVLNLQTPVALSDLRRHKRAFMKLTTNNTFLRVNNVALVKKLFIEYLKDQLSQGT